MTILADNAYLINSVQTKQDIPNGKYTFNYQVQGVYTYIYIYITVYTSFDNGASFSFYNISESPIVIELQFLGELLYGEYTDLVLGGLGETQFSNFLNVNTIIAGQNATSLFSIKPRNFYSQPYMHKDDKEYFFLSIYP